MMSKYLSMEQKAPEPLRRADGSLNEFMVRIGGKSYRCGCGCNVFHKPDKDDLDLYECNACGQQFEAV